MMLVSYLKTSNFRCYSRKTFSHSSLDVFHARKVTREIYTRTQATRKREVLTSIKFYSILLAR